MLRHRGSAAILQSAIIRHIRTIRAVFELLAPSVPGLSQREWIAERQMAADF